jgi:hypothetical protein
MTLAAAGQPPDTDGPPSFLLTRWVFLRLLGLIYLIAFASLAVQLPGLVGPHGLLPAGQYLEWAHTIYGARAYRLLPTLAWLGAGDTALHLLAWGGVGLAVLLIAGIAPMLVLALLWACYLSLVVVGQDFLSFQWDALLLETGLLAILYAPARWLPSLTRERSPSLFAHWLLLWLLFRLMFLSGATKLLSGDPTWRNLTALDYHFETQPLPPWTAWYAHHLPESLHRAATLGMFVVELGVPWLVLVPFRFCRIRLLAFAALVLFQLAIAATGNYGFFNALAIVLAVPLLDDRALGRVLPLRRAAKGPESPGRRRVVQGFGAGLLVLSGVAFVREMAYTLPSGRGVALVPAWAEAALEVVAPLRSINGYGLFRVMTRERPEIVIEGTRDGVEWRPYEFRWKPGPLTRRPSFVAPYHPRLDWQMWFAALGPPGSASWLGALVDALLAGRPEVLALLGLNPFPEGPPRSIRLVSYRYRFSTAEERAATGWWWVREFRGYLTRPISR